jgi:hypothetical protein
MFHKPVDTVPALQADVVPPVDLIPLSVLELDLPTPGEGWSAFLADRSISITIDDIGRVAIARGDARLLFTERRESEAKAREHAAAAELQAIERDRQFRASLGRGIPADAIPAGMTFGEVVASVELDSQTYRPRASMAEDLLSNDGSMTFHSFGPAPEE